MNQKGFSLIQVLVSVGIMGGLALALMQMQDNSTNITKSMEVNQTINIIFQEVNAVLSDSKNCTETFKGKLIEDKFKSFDEIKKVKSDGSIITLFAVNQKSPDKQILLEGMSYRETADEYLEFNLSLKRLSKKVSGSRQISKKMRLNFYKDASNVILGCGPITPEGSFEIISGEEPGMAGLSGNDACKAKKKKCVKVLSQNFIREDAKCNAAGVTHCMRVCATWYNESLPGVENGTDTVGSGPKDNIHTCDALLGEYTTYLHVGVVRCNAFFSAYCK